ncbi:MAG: hypothetical protein LC687_06380, partial [Actinobacteria bacterium]|nr:hypothetical protein [Actinomycetota bacterium]
DVVAIDVGSEGTGQAFLDIDAPNDIDTLNLSVSDGVYLNLLGEASLMEVFTITGSGVTDLSAADEFPNLITLDSTDYDGDLTLDISGSGTLENVLTGPGDDIITAAAANFSADTPPTTVNLGAGDNRLVLEDLFETQPTGTYTGGGEIDENEISALDFTLAPVSNVQTLELVDVDIDGDASLALEGVGGLETLVFNEFDNTVSGDDFAITGAPDTLLISATDEFQMDGLFTIEGVKDLTIESTGVAATDDVNGAPDSDVVLAGGLDSTTLETLIINAVDDAYLIDDGDLDALQSIELNALGDDAKLDLDNTTDGTEFGALTSINVSAAGDTGVGTDAGADADVDLNGFAPVQQVQTFEFTGSGNAGNLVLNFPGIGDVPIPYGSGNTAGKVNDIRNDINNNIDGYSATSNGNTLTITRLEAGPAPISFVSTSGNNVGLVGSAITTPGVAGAGFEAMEDVVVTAEDNANVNLVNVYGSFTVDVAAETVAEPLADAIADAGFVSLANPVTGDPADLGVSFVTLTNTGATEVNVTGGTQFEYTLDTTGEVNGLEYGDVTVVTLNEANGGIGNQDVTDVTVGGALVNVDLSGDLSSLTTVDLKGVTNHFDVNASGAEFDIAPGDYVSYLIGGTSSEYGADADLGGDSEITMNADGRETVTFTEADFGTVVLEGFYAGDDPQTADRIDLSELGFTNNGQLSFEVGDYDNSTNPTSGEWTADANGADVRITDLAGGPEMSGEIILTGAFDADANPAASYGVAGGQDLSDDLSAYNMVYA